MGQGKWLENEFSKMCFSSDSLSFGPINPQPKMSFMSAWVIAIYWISKVLTKVENPKPLCLCIYVLGFGFSKIFPGLDFGFQFLKWWFEFWCGVAENTFLDFVIVCSLLLGWLCFLKFIYWAWKFGFQFLNVFWNLGLDFWFSVLDFHVLWFLVLELLLFCKFVSRFGFCGFHFLKLFFEIWFGDLKSVFVILWFCVVFFVLAFGFCTFCIGLENSDFNLCI